MGLVTHEKNSKLAHVFFRQDGGWGRRDGVGVDDLEVDQFEELLDHPWLQFPPGTVVRNRRDRILRKEMGHQKALDYDLLTQLGEQQRMVAIIGEDTPLSRLFYMTYAPQYRLLTVEFLSTLVYRPQAPDFQPEPQPADISFRLCGDSYDLSLREFAMVTGLYTEVQTHMSIYTTTIHTADDAVVNAWWPWIGDELFVRSARVSRIHDPLIRLIDIDPIDMEAVHPVRLDRRTQLIQQQAQIQQHQLQLSHQLAHTPEQLTRRVDRLEDLISWQVHIDLRDAATQGIQLPVVPLSQQYPPPPPPPPHDD
ncbi:hypothetical protein R6Q57_022615 [Mikania cordata]